MEPERLSLKTLALAAAGVLTLEAVRLAVPGVGSGRLAVLGLIRAGQAFWLWHLAPRPNGAGFGLDRPTLIRGLALGAAVSLACCAAALTGWILLSLTGIDPRPWFRGGTYHGPARAALLLLVGGFVGPLVEELFFRGFVYGALRRWGAVIAVLGSTAAFVLAHGIGAGPPVFQVAGGIAFALIYERTGNLAASATVHVLGNMVLFMLAWRV